MIRVWILACGQHTPRGTEQTGNAFGKHERRQRECQLRVSVLTLHTPWNSKEWRAATPKNSTRRNAASPHGAAASSLLLFRPEHNPEAMLSVNHSRLPRKPVARLHNTKKGQISVRHNSWHIHGNATLHGGFIRSVDSTCLPLKNAKCII